MDIIFAILCVVITLLIFRAVKHGAASGPRSKFIETYRFPNKVKSAVLKRYPHLSNAEADRVIKGLREYFHVCNEAGKEFISMPSEVVDTAWHEFILFTREYQAFCQQAFGRFLHHTPAEAMKQPQKAQKGIRATWRLSCSRENINDRSPSKLPLLFVLDTALRIENDYAYQLDCSNSLIADGKVPYCASHIASGTHAGSGGGCGGSAGPSNDGGSGDAGCGSGCGGCGA